MKELVAEVEPVPVGTLISHLPQELDMLLRAWLRADPQMRCPGNPGTMPERAWAELMAVTEQVQADGKSDDPVGSRVTREPDFAELRAQWSSRAVRRRTTRMDDARSAETLQVAQSSRSAPPAGRQSWFSLDEDDPA